MKQYPTPFIILIITTLFIACNKDANHDSSFFIEAEINGVKWRSESTENYLATKSDNSKMKIYVATTNPPTGYFAFFANTFLTTSSYTNPDFTMQLFVIGAFDSQIRLKWETTAENNIERFEIERSVGNPYTFQTIGSIPGSGTSTTLKQYSFTDNNLNMASLNSLKYRIKAVTAAGTIRYTDAKIPNITVGNAQIVYQASNNKLYFALDNNENRISITSYDPATSERRGTFSFNYKDESGNIVQVTNGKFHLKL